jgi:Cytochrome bd-type quinol oxidase, subunit 2
MIVYLVVYPVTLYYMIGLVRAGPEIEEEPDRPIEGLQRPLPARAAAGAAGRPGTPISHGATPMMPLDFVPLWTLILGFGVFMYVLMDGFDLGVGILFRRAPNDAARDIMMNSVAPIWDGNETWLVLGGVALLAAFPLAFASFCRRSTSRS